MTKNTIPPKGMKPSPLVLLATWLLWANFAQAQQSINTSGGNATGSGGRVSYSVGQMVYTTEVANAGSVAQGVQHAYEILTVGVKETLPEISIGVYPNPTIDNLTLQVSDIGKQKLSYQLCDLQGKLINSGSLTAPQTQLITSGLAPASYYLHVLNSENKTVQSFQIIKY
jgi:hypothetical protein